MRVAVVIVPKRSSEELLKLARGLARGIQAQGHEVDILDVETNRESKLTIYKYIALGTENTTFWGGKIPERVNTFLASSGNVVGTRSFAFVKKSLIRSDATLQRLMRQMEKEGMFLKYSDILSSEEQAFEIGKNLIIEASNKR
jgi:menaquinone-dependent protoporphyrinogen IX oxidase